MNVHDVGVVLDDLVVLTYTYAGDGLKGVVVPATEWLVEVYRTRAGRCNADDVFSSRVVSR